MTQKPKVTGKPISVILPHGDESIVSNIAREKDISKAEVIRIIVHKYFTGGKG